MLVKTGKVKEVAAIGLADEKLGNKIILTIVLMPNEKKDKDYYQDLITRDLGKSFKPHNIIFVQDLPKTRNQKIMRRVIKSCLENKSLGDISMLLNPSSVKELKKFV